MVCLLDYQSNLERVTCSVLQQPILHNFPVFVVVFCLFYSQYFDLVKLQFALFSFTSFPVTRVLPVTEIQLIILVLFEFKNIHMR